MSESDDICGEPLSVRDGLCQNSIYEKDDDGEEVLKYPDEKCGHHSGYNESNQVQEPDNDLIQKYITRQKGKLKRSTWKSQRSACLALDEYLQERDEENPAEIGPLFIEDWAAWLMNSEGRGLAESSASEYVDSLSPFFGWLEKREDIEENPIHESDWRDQLQTSGIPQKQKVLAKRGEYFAPTTEQVEALIENAQAPDRFRSQLVIKMLAQTGVRPHELRNIKLRDVKNPDKPELWTNNRIVIHSSKTERYSGDRSGTRTVRYQDSLKFYLRKWMENYRESYKYAQQSEYLFPTNHRERFATSTIGDIVKNAAEAAGFQEVLWTDASGGKRMKYSPYCLRHYYASQMASELQPSELAQLMGSSVSTVEKYYVQIRDEKLDKAAEFSPDV